MANRSIVLTIRTNVAGAINGLRQLGGQIDRNAQHISTISTGLGIAGLALTAFAAVAVKKFMEFDAQMSNVQAVTHASAAEMELLTQAALRAGQTTVFSATQAAQGIEELAKAGISTSDILGGALTGTLDLAAAGQLSVADAATYASIAMSQFGLQGKDVAHVADLLAAGAGKALGDVKDLGMALRQGGLVASQTGLSIEETTAALASFAKAGLLGSDAGTSLKTMLQRLSNPSGEAATLMDELGISAYDASGQFVGLANFAGQLNSALGNMAPAQRNAALATIFGSDAVRAASVLYKEGSDGVNEWIRAVNDQGYAADVAAARLDNLKGDITTLGSALETAFIGLGSQSDNALRGLVQNTTDAVRGFSELPSAVQGVTMAIAGGGGLALLGVAAIGKLAMSAREAIGAFRALWAASNAMKFSMGAITAVLAVATIGLGVWMQKAGEATQRTTTLADTLDEFGNRTASTMETINKALAFKESQNVFQKMFGKDAMSAIEAAEKLGVSIEDVQGAIIGQAEAMDRVNAALDKYNVSAAEMQGGTSDVTEEEFQARNKLAEAIKEQSTALSEAQKQKLREAEANKAAGISADELTGSVEGTTSAVDAQVSAFQELIKVQAEAAGIVLSERDAQRAYESALDDVTASIEESAKAADMSVAAYLASGQALDITTEAGRQNQQALDGIAESGLDLAESMAKAGRSQADIQMAIQRTRDDFINVATSMGMSSDQAAILADNLNLIPGVYTPTIEIKADPTDAQAVLTEVLDNVQSATGTVKIDGDDAPVIQDLAGVTADIDKSKGTVTIYGNDGNAVTTLSAYKVSVDNTTGVVTITGNDSNGRSVTTLLKDWVGLQGSSIKVTANTDPAEEQVNQVIQRINSKRGTIYVDQKTGTQVAGGAGSVMMKAAGGPVYGPGTGTSDSIPAMLSNGEHVWTAMEVQALGGHGAVAKLRAAARSGGLLARASGGPVSSMPYRAPVAPPMASSQTPMLPDSMTLVDESGALLARVRVVARQESQASIRTAQARGRA